MHKITHLNNIFHHSSLVRSLIKLIVESLAHCFLFLFLLINILSHIHLAPTPLLFVYLDIVVETAGISRRNRDGCVSVRASVHR